MFTKTLLASALIAAGMLGGVALPVSSAVAAEIIVNVAPPANRYERVPSARRGYVWSPGHWQWNPGRKRYLWTAGNWERSRAGYAYHAPQWVERDGRWNYQSRRWDNDGDGIPNNRDATPNGGRRGDRDGDGVPNRNDRRPDNPNRS